MGSGGSSVQWGQQERLRPLITPDELRTLPSGQALVIGDTLAPFLVQLQPYYQSRTLQALAALPPVRHANGGIFPGDMILPPVPPPLADDDEDEEATADGTVIPPGDIVLPKIYPVGPEQQGGASNG